MHPKNALAAVDALLLRVLIPLWVLAGAVFKLIERDPSLLPTQIIAWFKANNHQDWAGPFMRLAIAVEIIAAALMIFVPKLSRSVAIAILSLFCAILIIELRANAESCGCMGNVSMPPWLMLTIDGGLLLGAIVLGFLGMKGPKPEAGAPKSAMPGVAIAAVVSIVGAGLAFMVPDYVPDEPEPVIVQNNTNQTQPNTNNTVPPANSNAQANVPTPPAITLPPHTIANPNPTKLGGYYMTSNTESWIGQPATEVDLIKYMRVWPDDIATGSRHIIFYSRTCDHCEAMFNDHLVMPQDLPVTAVEIPNSNTQLRGPNPWRMPQTSCQLLELPVGLNYVMTPPIIITIIDGKVSCAMEGEYEDCLGVESTHDH